MALKISQVQYNFEESCLGLCHRVHGAGHRPNAMNRFLISNTQEVLFVN
jgi:hypothetical protein